MAYTRPSASAADATFSGAAVYTRPAAGAADASFAPLNAYSAAGFTSSSFGAPASSRAQPASGFAPTTFGTPALNLNSTRLVTSLAPGTAFGAPVAAYSQFGDATGFQTTALGSPTSGRAQPATGFSTTQFGTAASLKTQRPTGFTSTQFGAPRLYPFHAVGFKPTTFGQARLFPFHVAPGLRSTQFGTPAGTQHWDVVAWPPVTRFGTPTTPTNRTAQAASFRPMHLGAPSAFRRLPPSLLQVERATGFRLTALGTPTAGWLQTALAVGLAPGTVGAPRGVMVQGAAGFASTVLGAPMARCAARASGFRPTTFGTPTARITLLATGPLWPARFGLPTSERSNTYLTYSINASGRFGQPAATCRHNRPATGFRLTAFGTPACYERHRVTHLAPGAQFGRALLKRTNQC